MMKKTIIGRVREQKLLKQLLNSKKSEFLAVYGRRRVGKTFLIRNFFDTEQNIFFYCSGLQKGKLEDQLKEFSLQIGKTFYHSAPIAARKNWLAALNDLTQAIAQAPSNKKIILFFDELPWLATPRSEMLPALDYHWNRYWSHNSRVKLVICGSCASWIIKKIINDKGGLYNRVTRTLHLIPFSLNESQDYLASRSIKLSQQQVISLYLVLGGIPHYLALIKKGLSCAQNIDALCFQQGGELINEFHRLFDSLFNNAEYYIKLIRVIASHRYGIGQTKLAKEAAISDGGRLKRKLKDLEDAGFILSFIPHGHREKGIYYKVIDEFTLFYLRWMKPQLKSISKQDRNSAYWALKQKSPQYHAWSGLAFEAICYKHLAQIKKAIGITVSCEIGSWRYAPRKQENKGAQIDLLFDRDDDVISICEIKYNTRPFVINKEYAQNLLNKLAVYQKRIKTQKQLLLVIITNNKLKPSLYSEEIISNEITSQDLFTEA